MIDSRGYVIELSFNQSIVYGFAQRKPEDKAIDNHGRPFEHLLSRVLLRRDKTMIGNYVSYVASCDTLGEGRRDRE